MDEKKFVRLKQEELEVREYIKNALGKGRISEVDIEYTPVGEKIVVSTNRPGQVIGSKGNKINELTTVLKRRFKLDNPHIEIRDIMEPLFDAQLVADEIALALERKGSLKFKLIAYRMLDSIMKAGALGAEIVLSGRLPSERAKSWRFAQGYLKKTGDPAKVVNRAIVQGQTMAGVIGIKVSILPKNAPIHDRIVVDDFLMGQIRGSLAKENLRVENLGKEPEVDNMEVVKKMIKKRKKKASNAGESN